jgi:hypothetical protein
MTSYVTTQDLVIDDLSSAAALAEALKWWSFMNGGIEIDTVTGQISANTLAHPKYVAASGGVDAHFLFSFAQTPVEVAGAYSTKALMDADLVPVASTLVNCWDPDPTKRGRYSKTGGTGVGSWTLVTPTPADKAWSDYNHPQRLLELLICSWVYSTAPLPYMGSQQGWVGPSDGNWMGARVTLDIEFQQVHLGPYSKVGLHVQGNVPSRAAALSALYPESPNPKYFLPNFIQRTDLISDALDFAFDSWGLPNSVPVVRSSSRQDVVIHMTGNDDDFACFGDTGRDPTGRLISYGEAPVAEVLGNLQGNMYVLAHHPTPKDGDAYWTKSSAESVPNFDRFIGDIRLFGVKVEVPA